MKELLNLLGAVLLIITIIVSCWLLVTLPYYLIWNWAISPLLGLWELNYYQCMILAFLFNLGYMFYAAAYDSKKVPDDRDI